MPRIKYEMPPAGGEKWLCRSIQQANMFCVICTVIIIYMVVIIYNPSIREMETKFIGPKRCTTTLILRNITGTPVDGKCAWASCMEWCLSSGSSPCSKMFGKIREVGANINFSSCSLEEDAFVDHTCSTLEDLKAHNCKRSQWEPRKLDGKEISEGDSWKCPGQREMCKSFNNLISCEAGYCKNVTKIYQCTFKNALEDLLEPMGSKGQIDGYCNCNKCTTSNTTLVAGQDLVCPKGTEFCFLDESVRELMVKNGKISAEKLKEICGGEERVCETCMDICKERRHCLDIKSRRDVILLGVDYKSEPEPKLTYYDCKEGNCTLVYDLHCNRTCDYQQFDMKKSNVIFLQGERIVMASCDLNQAVINASQPDEQPLPDQATRNPRTWTNMMMSCSDININNETGSIEASDCVNGTWIEDLTPLPPSEEFPKGSVDYNLLTKHYFEERSNEDRWVKRERNDELNMIAWEEDITIWNFTKLLKNQEGCVNTLAMECMDFFHRYGRDGANYTQRAVFDCYYDPHEEYSEDDWRKESYVVVDYMPKRTFKFLLLWSIIPAIIVTCSCIYMCTCSKLTFTGDDGHMRMFCCGKACTGIGNVIVYKPPSKNSKS